jgi:phage-related tail fiber protein
MGVPIQRRGGTTAEHSSFTGKQREVTIDTTKWTVVVHDGSTLGGYPLAKENHVHGNASPVVAGFMSASDKSKLDDLPASVVYQQVQTNSTPGPARAALNFAPAFAVTDDNAGNKTTVDLSDLGISPAQYTKVTVNAQGRVTAATVLSAADIPSLTSAKITDFNATVQTNRIDQLTAPTGSVNLNTQKIINLLDPTNPQDAATKAYVDSARVGLEFKESVRAASTANINLTLPGTTIDGVTLVNGDRILLKDQTTTSQNGIYVFAGPSTPLSRAADSNTSDEMLPGTFVLVTEGSVNGDTAWVLATDAPITLDTTGLDWVQFSGANNVAAGDGLSKVGNTLSVRTANASRIVVGGSGVDLATTGVGAGTYNTLTVDVYGRITTASNTAYQAQNTLLTNFVGLGSSIGIVAKTATSTVATRTLTAGTGISITNGDGVSGDPTIAQTADTVVQRLRLSKGGTLVGTRRELNFIDGTGISIDVVDDTPTNRTNVTINQTGGVSSSAQFVCLANDGTLSNERVLTAGTGISITDGGAGNNVTVAIVQDLGAVP